MQRWTHCRSVTRERRRPTTERAEAAGALPFTSKLISSAARSKKLVSHVDLPKVVTGYRVPLILLT